MGRFSRLGVSRKAIDTLDHRGGRIWHFPRVFLVIAISAAVAAAAPPLMQDVQQRNRATPVAVADAVCANCHKDLFQAYLRTPMANASGEAAEGAVAGEFLQKSSGVRFTVEVSKGEAWLSYSRPGVAPPFGIDGRRRLEYFIGSGLRARTYLSRIDDFWFEAPINWYTAAHAYDMRPGREHSLEVDFDLPTVPFCLSCHTSKVQPADPGTRNRYAALPFLHTGITCEACHGDTSKHVASGGKAAVVNPVKLDAEQRDSICEQCHLEAEFVVEKRGKSKAGFSAGSKISDYVSYFVHEAAPKAAAGAVTQVEALAQSACKRASGNRLSCITCHDPHDRPTEANQVQYYRGKCLVCHTQPRFATAHHSENPDCAGCHMPRNPAIEVSHQQVTDHRILRVPHAPNVAAVQSAAPHHLVALLADAGARDTGLAYAQLARTDAAVIDTALRYLRLANTEDANDSRVLSEMGILLEAKHLTGEAKAAYEQALKADPNNARAGSRLGLIYLHEGNTGEAISLWNRVFEREPNYVGADLAEATCSAGDRTRTISVLQRLIRFYPDMTEARLRLSSIETDKSECVKRSAGLPR